MALFNVWLFFSPFWWWPKKGENVTFSPYFTPRPPNNQRAQGGKAGAPIFGGGGHCVLTPRYMQWCENEHMCTRCSQCVICLSHCTLPTTLLRSPIYFLLLLFFKKKERNLQGTGRRVQSHASRSGHLAVVRCIVDLFQKCLQQLCGCPTIVCCHAAKVCCGCGERNQKNMINGKM